MHVSSPRRLVTPNQMLTLSFSLSGFKFSQLEMSESVYSFQKPAFSVSLGYQRLFSRHLYPASSSGLQTSPSSGILLALHIPLRATIRLYLRCLSKSALCLMSNAYQFVRSLRRNKLTLQQSVVPFHSFCRWIESCNS